jgi:hypothetical protein
MSFRQAQEFDREPEAVTKARVLVAADDRGEFVIEDEEGKIVLTDKQIRKLCKVTKIPRGA